VETIQICKNEKAEKYCIYFCDGPDKDSALVVTPDGKVELRSFQNLLENLEDVEEGRALEAGQVTPIQLEIWHKYQKDQSEEWFLSVISGWENLTLYERDEIRRMMQEK